MCHYCDAVVCMQAGIIGFITLQQSAPSQMTSYVCTFCMYVRFEWMYTYACMYARLLVSMHVLHVCTLLNAYVCALWCAYICMYALACICMQTLAYTCMHALT